MLYTSTKLCRSTASSLFLSRLNIINCYCCCYASSITSSHYCLLNYCRVVLCCWCVVCEGEMKEEERRGEEGTCCEGEEGESQMLSPLRTACMLSLSFFIISISSLSPTTSSLPSSSYLSYLSSLTSPHLPSSLSLPLQFLTPSISIPYSSPLYI